MTRTVDVKDPKAQKFIGTLKKGDEVELTYTEALVRIAADSIRSTSRDRRLTAVRIALALEALDGRIASLKEIAEFLGRRPASLSELLTRHRRR